MRHSIAYNVTLQRNSTALSKPLYRCTNPYVQHDDDGFHFYNCGKCDYCNYVRSVNLSQRVKDEMKLRKYAIFITLTYDNDHVPTLTRSSETSKWYHLNRTKRNSDGTLCTPIVHYSDMVGMHELMSRGQKIPDTYGVLWQQDVIDFKKRLLQRIYRRFIQYDEGTSEFKAAKKKYEVRFFISGEYGETFLRPHYHGVLWTDNEEVANYLSGTTKRFVKRADGGYVQQSYGNLSACWQMCDSSNLNIQPLSTNNNTASYVASYINSVNTLPEVLKLRSYRPSYVCTKNPLIGSRPYTKQDVIETLVNRDYERVSFDKDEQRHDHILLPYSYFDRYFPRAEAHSVSSLDAQLSLYQKYRDAKYKKKSKHHLMGKYVSPDVGIADSEFNDKFSYRTQRWFRFVDRYSGVPLTYRKYVGDVMTDEYVTRTFTPRDVIMMLRRVWSDYDYYRLISQITDESVIMSSDNGYTQNLLHTSQYYVGQLLDLPKVIYDEDISYYDKVLHGIGFSVGDFYTDNDTDNGLYLDSRVLSYTLDRLRNPLCNQFDKDIRNYIRNKSKNKKYKAHLAQKAGDYCLI